MAVTPLLSDEWMTTDVKWNCTKAVLLSGHNVSIYSQMKLFILNFDTFQIIFH